MTGPLGGAPTGNKNASKEWKLAIRRALAHKGEELGGDWRIALDTLAKKFISLCDNGDLAALKELADRLDGKAPQAVQLTGGEDEDGNALPFTPKVIVEYVSANGAPADTTPPAP